MLHILLLYHCVYFHVQRYFYHIRGTTFVGYGFLPIYASIKCLLIHTFDEVLCVGQDRGVGDPGVRGSGVGGLLTKNGRGSDGRGAGAKIRNFGRGYPKKKLGKKGAGVGRENLGGGRGLNPGGRGSRPPCRPPPMCFVCVVRLF